MSGRSASGASSGTRRAAQAGESVSRERAMPSDCGVPRSARAMFDAGLRAPLNGTTSAPAAHHVPSLLPKTKAVCKSDIIFGVCLIFRHSCVTLGIRKERIRCQQERRR